MTNITVTDISDKDLPIQVAIINTKHPTKIIKIKQSNGLWTIIGEFPDDADIVADAPTESDIASISVFAKKLASVAEEQYTLFHSLKESNPTLCKQIEKYWDETVGGFTSCTAIPWSGVFVSWCVKQAGATSSEFSFSSRHAIFVHKAIQNALDHTGVFQGHDITTHTPNVGDIIQNNRSGNSFDFAYAKAHDNYESHSAIVLEIGQDAGNRFAITIGGNESQSIGRKTVPLTAAGFIKQRSSDPFISIIKNLK